MVLPRADYTQLVFAFNNLMRNSDTMTVFGGAMGENKIREARRAKGWTQQDLAERMGTTQQTIQRYERGTRSLRASVLARLSEVLDVTVAYLLGMSEDDAPRAGTVDVPLYGPIAVGKPLEEAESEPYPIPTEVRGRWPHAFLLRIEGESMDRILPSGCYALVDPCAAIDYDGQPYAVRVGDLGPTVRRVRRIPGGLRLAPDSNDPSFRPQDFHLAGQGETTLSVIGRVVWHCIPYDWSY